MSDRAQLKYGAIKGIDLCPVLKVPMGASEVVAAASGRFVTRDASGRAEIAGDGSTLIYGWVELPEGKNYNASGIYTCSSTEGEDVAPFLKAEQALGVVFCIPINSGTYAATMIGETCDLSVSSNIQGVQLDASAEDTLIIVDGDTVNNEWVDVILNPSKLTGQAAVA